MAKPIPTPDEQNVFILLRKLEETKKSHLDSAVTDIQKRLQSVADDIKLLGQPNFLSQSAFEQPLMEMGVVLKSLEEVPEKRKSSAIQKPIKDTPLANEIVEVVKAKGKVDSAGLVTAMEGKAAKATVVNYVSRLVNEGVLHRPERGVFSVRQ